MEPKFQSSFIPKRPIVGSAPGPVSVIRTTNLFSVLATVIFILAIGASGGLYIYKNVLSGQIGEADKNLASARAAFQPEKIQELADINGKLLASNALLGRHMVVSRLLSLFQTLTVKRMRFTSLTYTAGKDTPPTVSIIGEAATYNALAQQEAIFRENEFIKDPQFSNFELSESGNVSVKFFASIDLALVLYKNMSQ